MAESNTPVADHEPYIPASEMGVANSRFAPSCSVHSLESSSALLRLLGVKGRLDGLSFHSDCGPCHLGWAEVLQDDDPREHIIQTCGSAGESVAAEWSYPAAFLLLSNGVGEQTSIYHHYRHRHCRWHSRDPDDDPLRRSLIVKEHATLPYPEGRPALKC